MPSKSLVREVFIDRPTPIFTGAIALASAGALTSAPSFVPMVALVTILHIYTRLVVPRSARIGRAFLAWLVVTLGVSAAHLPTAADALASVSQSLGFLFLASGASTVSAFIALFLDHKIGSRAGPTSQLLLFPAVWATTWAFLSFGPVGHIFTWSPVQGIEAYRWVRPYVGQWGIDWIVGAWASVISQAVGMWVMGPKEDESVGEVVGPLVSFEGDDNAGTAQTSPSTKSRRPFPSLVILAGLLALTIPSYTITNIPLPVRSDNIMPITVGCVLPGAVTGNPNPPQLTDFIQESRILTGAPLIIWPEGSVQFNSEGQRNQTLATVHHDLLSNKTGSYIGVGFEETIATHSKHGQRHLRRNGFLVMNSDGDIVHEYYKRNLVPVAESFSMTAGTDAATETTLDWPWTKHRKTRETRPIPITSSICLDFASSSPFGALPTRPALILASARTWHIGAGLAMWEQAKARAEEIGSTILWCDGGEGGVSGVAGVGAGAGEIIRVGQGSWQTTVAIPWPVVEERTMYAAGGDWMVLVMVWSLVGVPKLLEVLAARSVLQAPRATLRAGPMMLLHGFRTIWATVTEKRRALRAPSSGEQQSLLA